MHKLCKQKKCIALCCNLILIKNNKEKFKNAFKWNKKMSEPQLNTQKKLNSNKTEIKLDAKKRLTAIIAYLKRVYFCINMWF